VFRSISLAVSATKLHVSICIFRAGALRSLDLHILLVGESLSMAWVRGLLFSWIFGVSGAYRDVGVAVVAEVCSCLRAASVADCWEALLVSRDKLLSDIELFITELGQVVN